MICSDGDDRSVTVVQLACNRSAYGVHFYALNSSAASDEASSSQFLRRRILIDFGGCAGG